MFRKSLVAIALLCAASLSMADTVYVTEFKPGPVVGVYYQAVNTPAVAKQAIAVTGTSAQSSAFAADTGIVRIHPDVAILVEIGGTNPSATSTSMRMEAGQTEYFVVKPGQKLAVKTP